MSKAKFGQESNRYKRVLEAVTHVYANKTKESITSQKTGSRTFLQIANSVLYKGKSAIPPLFHGPEMLISASHKAKLLPEIFSDSSYLDDSGIFLPTFLPGINLKLLSIPIIPMIVPMKSSPDCISVLVPLQT